MKWGRRSGGPRMMCALRRKMLACMGNRVRVMMKTSEQINELATALAKAQAELPTVPKRGRGQYNSFATLDDIIDASRQPLADNGLSFVQLPTTPPVEYGPAIGLTTMLMHTSGQWMSDTLTIPLVTNNRLNEAQSTGLIITYARRYMLSALLGLASDEDTDGEVEPVHKRAPRKKPAKNGALRQAVKNTTKPSKDQLAALDVAGKAVHGDEWENKRRVAVEWATDNRTNKPEHLSQIELDKILARLNSQTDKVSQ